MPQIYHFHDTDAGSISVAGWTKDGSWWVSTTTVACSTGNVSALVSGHKFASSANTAHAANAEAYRVLDVSAYATDIDAGTVNANLSGYINTYLGDSANYALEFYDGSDVIIGSRVSGTPIDPNCETTFQEVNSAVPVNTRKIRLILFSTYGAGSQNNGYYQEFSVYLTGVTNGEEVVATSYDVNSVVDRSDVEVVVTGMNLIGVVDRDEEEAAVSAFYVMAVVDRGVSAINQNVPTSIMCFA